MAPNRVMLANSAQLLRQKRMTATQEIIRRLLNTKRELSCSLKQRIISEYMQLLRNSGKRPLYRDKKWRSSSQGLEDQKRRKAKKWLGETYKSHIFVPPTPGSELQKLMQNRERERDPSWWKGRLSNKDY